MILNVVNETAWRVPRAFLKRWVDHAARELKIARRTALTIAFVGRARSQRLNHRFRAKKKPTDVLSFSAVEPGSLGELVVCVPLVKAQARAHDLTVNEELGYLVLHGMLHLLGYEHERGGAQARRMFALQDRLFESLCAFTMDDKRNKT